MTAQPQRRPSDDLYMSYRSARIFRNPLLRGHLVNQLFPENREMPVDKNWFLLGVTNTGKPLYMNMAEVSRVLVAAPIRTGKTSILRRRMDLAFHSDWSVVAFDIKDEFKTSREPQSAKFLPYLAETDVPQGVPMKVYRFAFMQTMMREQMPAGNEPFIIGFRDVSPRELAAVMGISGKPELELIVQELAPKAKTLAQFRDLIMERKKPRLLQAVNTLIANQVLGEETTPFQAALGSNVVVFNIKDYDQVGSKGSTSVAVLYMSIIIRLLADHKRRDKRRLLLIIEEAPALLDDRSPLYEDIKTLVYRLTDIGIFVDFATQTADEVPDEILKQMRYALFPATLNTLEAGHLMRLIGSYEYRAAGYHDLAMQMKSMKVSRDKLQWVLLDAKTRTNTIFRPFMSLSRHRESQLDNTPIRSRPTEPNAN